ncbi:hypothetical protein CC78DRAFT_537809 [Lojkania enalia]|uniref:Uncharacterized protein n=1 Tax=Lojkania enalia TaxID=147567 RepID=A0A9P4N165_9PLEO|nr:hypothetical protein CC78DRAFT_537809 [Didymosphaeria enalia]
MDEIFGDFSFEAAARQPPSVYEAERAAMNVSPTTTTALALSPLPARLPTPPPCSIGELAHRFNQHSLRVEVDPAYCRPAYFYEPLTPPSDELAFHTSFPEPTHQPSYTALSPAELRMRRQASTRMQCSQTHIKDISELVRKMIEEGDQCQTCGPKSRTSYSLSASSSSSDVDEDEGVDMDYDPPAVRESPLYGLKFRRSGDRLVGHAAVSKSVRMRKKSKVMKKSSTR